MLDDVTWESVPGSGTTCERVRNLFTEDSSVRESRMHTRVGLS